MLAFAPYPVNEAELHDGYRERYAEFILFTTEDVVAEVKIQDGIIKVVELEVQDPRAAAVLAEYPEARWAEVTRRAIKIGLGYLKGGAQD